MATYERRERVTRHVEFVVPATRPYGACWNEVEKAIDAATREWRRDRGAGAEAIPPDNEISVMPSDEDLIVYFEAKGGA